MLYVAVFRLNKFLFHALLLPPKISNISLVVNTSILPFNPSFNSLSFDHIATFNPKDFIFKAKAT
jgi:hypothetical protein